MDNDLPIAFSAFCVRKSSSLLSVSFILLRILLILGIEVTKLSVQVALLLTVQRLLLLAMPFCLLVVYVVQRFYLMTSRQLRLLDLESRSAVFSSFLETVRNLTLALL